MNNIVSVCIITEYKSKWFGFTRSIWFRTFTICFSANIECFDCISRCICFCYSIGSSWKLLHYSSSTFLIFLNFHSYRTTWNIFTILILHIKCKCSICVRFFRYILCDLDLTFDDMNLINTIWIVAIIWIISLLSSSYDMLFGVRFTLIRWCRLWIISYFQIILCIIIRCCCHILFTDIGLSSIFPL